MKLTEEPRLIAKGTQIEQERGTQICARFGLNDLLYKIDEAYLADDTLTV